MASIFYFEENNEMIDLMRDEDLEMEMISQFIREEEEKGYAPYYEEIEKAIEVNERVMKKV